MLDALRLHHYVLVCDRLRLSRSIVEGGCELDPQLAPGEAQQVGHGRASLGRQVTGQVRTPVVPDLPAGIDHYRRWRVLLEHDVPRTRGGGPPLREATPEGRRQPA